MNLNEFARKITLLEGQKVNLSIGQVKEVMRLIFRELAKLKVDELIHLIGRYKCQK